MQLQTKNGINTLILRAGEQQESLVILNKIYNPSTNSEVPVHKVYIKGFKFRTIRIAASNIEVKIEGVQWNKSDLKQRKTYGVLINQGKNNKIFVKRSELSMFQGSGQHRDDVKIISSKIGKIFDESDNNKFSIINSTITNAAEFIVDENKLLFKSSHAIKVTRNAVNDQNPGGFRQKIKAKGKVTTDRKASSSVETNNPLRRRNRGVGYNDLTIEDKSEETFTMEFQAQGATERVGPDRNSPQPFQVAMKRNIQIDESQIEIKNSTIKELTVSGHIKADLEKVRAGNIFVDNLSKLDGKKIDANLVNASNQSKVRLSKLSNFKNMIKDALIENKAELYLEHTHIKQDISSDNGSFVSAKNSVIEGNLDDIGGKVELVKTRLRGQVFLNNTKFIQSGGKIDGTITATASAILLMKNAETLFLNLILGSKGFISKTSKVKNSITVNDTSELCYLGSYKLPNLYAKFAQGIMMINPKKQVKSWSPINRENMTHVANDQHMNQIKKSFGF